MIFQVSVVLKRIVVHSNWRFDKSCYSHLQSQIDQLLRSYIWLQPHQQRKPQEHQEPQKQQEQQKTKKHTHQPREPREPRDQGEPLEDDNQLRENLGSHVWSRETSVTTRTIETTV